MQFSNSHARTFIRLNSVVYIFFSFTRNFVLSVEFPPKRPEKESWNSLEFFHDGIRRRHYGFQMISLSKNSSSYFLQSSMKEIQPRQVFILKVLVIAPNFKASSIFQFLHRLHVWQPHDPMLVKTFHLCEKRMWKIAWKCDFFAALKNHTLSLDFSLKIHLFQTIKVNFTVWTEISTHFLH